MTMGDNFSENEAALSEDLFTFAKRIACKQKRRENERMGVADAGADGHGECHERAAHVDGRGPRGLFNPNRPLNCYAQTYFGINPTISRHGIAQARLALLIWLNEMVLFVICLSVYQLQWNPIAPSKRKDICSKI